MRKVVSGIYQETQYPGVPVYLLKTDAGTFIIDCPLYSEDVDALIERAAELGPPRYVALLDSQHDRVLGARELSLPIIAHDHVRERMLGWSDTFKGAANPIGGEADSIRRITGVKAAVPEITFSDEMLLHLAGTLLHFIHRPGPTPGAMWISIPDRKLVFIGDAVHLAEPPFIGEADIDAWLEGLDDLRDRFIEDYTVISSRDGIIDRDEITLMARFLRKVPVRIDRLRESNDVEQDAEKIAEELLSDFRIPPAQVERMRLRLSAGLLRMKERLYPTEKEEETE